MDSSTSDEVTASIQFNEILPKYIVGIPSSITYNNNYTRTGSIDGNGNVTEIRQNGDSGFDRVLNYERDPYGNVTKITYPENAGSERKFVEIAYDSELHALPVKVNDILGYFSKTDYDPRYQVPLLTTDIGGSVMRYSYDARGRIKTIQSPKDNVPTIKYDYSWNASITPSTFNSTSLPKWVTTSHYTGGNYIKVKTYSDAFGNIIELDKTIDLGGSNEYYATGIKIYDNLGNVLAEVTKPYVYYSTDFNTMQFANVVNGNLPYRKYKYDKWCRNTKITEPNNIEFITTDYGFGTANNVGCFTTSVTDAASQTSTVWKDVRGLQIQMQSPLGATTQFKYDGLGQLLKTIDPEQHETTFQYDILGRTVQIDHPSRGLATWAYDGATSNVLEETNAKGEVTSYKYDILGRPILKHFSVNYQNDVLYKYGNPNTGYQSGKLIKLQDATGVTEFEYGNMGEVTAQNRMHILPNGSWLTHRTEWIYDSWGRTRFIVYPDGEQVNYGYNNAGQLKWIKSSTNGVYIDNISYNENEQKTQVVYGNSTKAKYQYDPIMKRLTSQQIYDNFGKLIMEKKYSYNNNIGNIDNQNDFYTFAGQNYNINHTYMYDEDNRLKQANAVSPNSVLNYSLTMAYSPAGRIDTLSLTSTALKNGYQTSENYVDYYFYDKNDNPYAVKTINDNKYCWDRLGNMSAVYFKGKTEELMYWTEDNRMQSYNNMANGQAGFYRYDAGGQRELKLTGKVSDINPMGRPYYYVDFQDAVLYAGNLMTIDKGGYKKHYFMESERFLTNIGGGNGQANVAVNTEIDGIEPRQPREMSDIYTKFVTNYFTEHKHSCEETMNAENILKNIPQLEKIFSEATQQSINDLHYYLHNDQLGSGSVVTNGSGNATQVLDYQPYGQDFLEMSAGFQTDYRFGGKIRDAESGLMQFADRYLNSRIKTPYSPDTHWFNRMHLSPYAWCSNDPINRIDPDGMDDYGLDENTGRLSLVKTTNDEYDNVFVGSYNEDGVFSASENGTQTRISKGILNATDTKTDLSKTGFIAEGGKQKEGIALARFISFMCHIELSGWGYDKEGKDATEVFRWDENNWRRSWNYAVPSSKKGFHFHTHPDDGKGRGGWGTPSEADMKFAKKEKVPTFIISSHSGVVSYSQYGAIPDGIAAPLPASLIREGVKRSASAIIVDIDIWF